MFVYELQQFLISIRERLMKNPILPKTNHINFDSFEFVIVSNVKKIARVVKNLIKVCMHSSRVRDPQILIKYSQFMT